MGTRTQHYSLDVHGPGDFYSASKDRRRMTIIDNEMAFISDRIGNGRIDGWNVTVNDLATREIKISSGAGLINRYIVFSYGPYFQTLSNNKTYYVYMRKRDALGGFSSWSDMAEYEHTDAANPNNPTNLSAVAASSYSMTISWTASTSVDVENYVIERTTTPADASSWTTITTTSSTSYTDTNLSQNTIYYYRIVTYDYSGNTSTTANFFGMTPADMSTPMDVPIYNVYAGNEIVSLLWEPSPTDLVSQYRVELQAVDDQNVNIGSPIVRTYSSSTTYAVVKELTNNIAYKVTLYAITENSVLSGGVTRTITPVDTDMNGEVDDVTVTYYQTMDDNESVGMDIQWNYSPDPYLEEQQADKYLITLVENGEYVSEVYEVSSSETDYQINLLSYRDDNNNIVHRFLRPRRIYYIHIQTQNVNGDISNGIWIRSESPILESPDAPTNLAVDRQTDNSLYFTWQPSQSDYISYYAVSCQYENLDTGATTVITTNTNVGTSTSYTLASSYYAQNRRFRFTVYAVDDYGNTSDSKNISYQIQSDDSAFSPSPPRNAIIENGDRSVSVKWDIITDGSIANYKVYRANFSTVLQSSDFSLLSTLPYTQGEYIDFEVTNNSYYTYIVSAVDVLGNESANPATDTNYSGSILIGHPNRFGLFAEPENFQVAAAADPFDLDLTWDASSGDFDGYEIYRSNFNKYSFAYVDAVAATETTYTDEDVLLETGTYYYVIRKYRNEVSLFVTESTTKPSDSVILATVTTSNSGISIDQTVARELKDLEDVVGEEVQEQVDSHHHDLITLYDKRIDLRGDIIVTSWETTDYKTYTTTTDIEGATTYIISISGELNEDYFKDDDGNVNSALYQKALTGTPIFDYEIDQTNNRITFSDYLYTECVEPEPDPLNPDRRNVCPSVPYSQAPTVSLQLYDITEVQGALPDSKIQNLSATQVQSGTVNENQLPSIWHEGRIQETLLPIQSQMVTDDNVNYYPVDNDATMGDAITFFDIISLSGTDYLLAATSYGIMRSTGYGNEWENASEMPYPVSKLFYSSTLNTVLALTNYGVYYSQNTESSSYGKWTRMSGMENVNIVRDIIEDNSGNLYVSTDLGVYRLDIDKAYVQYMWEQLDILGLRSTQGYALLYDTIQDRIIVSNELGILESTNQGNTWSFTNELPVSEVVYQFVLSGNYIFALTKHDIYRKKGNGNFIKISDIDADYCRKMVLFNGRLFFSSNEGQMGTKEDENIFLSTDLTIVFVWPEMNIRDQRIPVTSLNTINNQLFIGTDRRLFIYDSDENIWIQYDGLDSTIPSYYLNEEMQTIGFTFNNQGETYYFSFDEYQDFDAVVTYVSSYTNYVATHGGWANRNYLAPVTVWKNDIDDGDSSTISLDMTQFSSFTFPSYTEANANTETANTYKTQAENSITTLTSTTDTSNLRVLVKNVYDNLELFYSQLFPDLRYTITETNGGEIITNVSFPKIEFELYDTSGNESGITVDASTGTFVFDDKQDKYDIIKADIKGATLTNIGSNTHREVEDSMELMNSGLYSSLSQVQHVNIVNFDIFKEKRWPDSDENSPMYHSTTIIPRNDNFFDTLNSTINYELEISEPTVSSSLNYPAAVSYSHNGSRVFVGGKGAILSIDISSLNISEVTISQETDINVRDIYCLESETYVVSEDRIYLSEDYGINWTALTRSGLPNELYAIGYVGNNYVVGAEDGLYFKSRVQDSWVRAVESTNPVEVVYGPDLLFAIVDNKLYATGDGVSYILYDLSLPGSVNSIGKYNRKTFFATDSGLYTDSSTLYSASPRLALIDLLQNPDESKGMVVNDVYGGTDYCVCGISDSSYYLLKDDNFEFQEFSKLMSVHKVLMIEDSVWLFGYNLFKVDTVDYPLRLTTGVPI